MKHENQTTSETVEVLPLCHSTHEKPENADFIIHISNDPCLNEGLKKIFARISPDAGAPKIIHRNQNGPDFSIQNMDAGTLACLFKIKAIPMAIIERPNFERFGFPQKHIAATLSRLDGWPAVILCRPEGMTSHNKSLIEALIKEDEKIATEKMLYMLTARQRFGRDFGL